MSSLFGQNDTNRSQLKLKMTEQGHKKEMRTQLRRVRPAQLQLITNKDMTSKTSWKEH